MLIALALFALSTYATRTTGAAEFLPNMHSFGLFTTESQDGKSGCAAIDAGKVTIGAPVTIVVLATPQRQLAGIVQSRSSAQCTRYFQGSASADFYDVRITSGKFAPHELGVAVLPGLALRRDGATLRAVTGKESYRFFECASTEGIHVAVRAASGKKKAPVIWHDYLYLGFDVEPTCQPSDYAAFDALRKKFENDQQTPAR